MSTHNALEFAVRGILGRMERAGTIFPGAAERLVSVLTPHITEASAAPGAVLDFVYGTPQGRLNLTDPADELGSGASGLRRVIAMLPVRESHRESVYAKLAARAGHLNPARQADVIAQYLESRAGREDHASPPPLPFGERRVAAMIGQFQSLLRPEVDADGLAQRWANHANGISDAELARTVASRLATRGLVRDGEAARQIGENLAEDARRNPRVNPADVERLSAAYGQSL
jgi:hypothetical protein